MELLLKKKRFTKGKLTRVLSAKEGTEQLSSVDIDIHLSKLEQIAGDIDQLFSSINELCTGEEFTMYQDEFQELEDKLHVSRRTLLSQHSLLNSSPCPPVQVDSKSCDIKLPKLELPTFNGKFHLWSSFRDLSVAAVHKNSTLSGAQKLQYLKSALTDEPAGLISSVPLTDANYTDAWQILNERYQNRREIVAAHLDKFINQPLLHFESASALRSLADTSAESIRALRVLEVPVNYWDAILVHLLVKKLDAESRRQWELSLSDDSIPEFCKLHKFIDQRARALAAAGLTTEKTATRSTPQQKSGKSAQVHHATVKRACEYCQKEHSIYKCDEFQKLTPTQRHQFATGKQLCFNCLRANHVTADCKSGHCQQCSYRHHTLLHFGNTTKTNQEFECGNKPVNSHFVNDSNHDSQVILATSLIKVTNESGRSMVLRALLDSASEASFITEHWVQKLKLKKFKINTPISGIGATGITNARSGVNLNFTSLIDDKHRFTIHALTLPKITGLLPSTNLDVNNWDHIKSLKLADPQFNKPAKIDVLLGADVFFTLLRSGQLAAPDGLLSVQETVLGWILAGKIQQPPATHIKVHHSTCSTEHILQQFWESEELSASPPFTQEEVQCENHFKTTFSRNEQSRYVVKLPFKQSQPSLGSSRDSAILRLKQIERKLARNPELHKYYSDF